MFYEINCSGTDEKYQYAYRNQNGFDVSPDIFIPVEKNSEKNFFFTDAKNVFKFLDDDCVYLKEIILPLIKDFEMIQIDNDRWSANKIIFGKTHKLNKIKTWKYLIKSGADIHANNDRAVRWASYNGYLDIVKYLQKLGAGISTDALEEASRNGHLEIVKYLVEFGAKISADALKEASRNGHLEIVKYLVEFGAKISADALKEASRNGYLEIVKYLVEFGAKISADALKEASRNGYLEIVKCLVEFGAKISADALKEASRNGYLEIVKCLVEFGAKISTDALEEASRNGHLEIVKYFGGIRSENLCRCA